MTALWTEEMSMDIHELDRDHRRILQQIQNLQPAIDAPRLDAHRVSLLLRDLERYVIEHAAREEEALWETDYPDVYAHIAEHARLTEYLAGMRQEMVLRGPERRLLQQSTRLLAGWIAVHVNTADRAFAAYLRELRDLK